MTKNSLRICLMFSEFQPLLYPTDLDISTRKITTEDLKNCVNSCIKTVTNVAYFYSNFFYTTDEEVEQDTKLNQEWMNAVRNLTKRKEEVSSLITEQGNMTEEIEKALNDALTLTEVEDIYRPFKPKRKTRASVAIAKGLQPLADKILEQKPFESYDQVAYE